jgi:superfamily II DNA or RNA helicase
MVFCLSHTYRNTYTYPWFRAASSEQLLGMIQVLQSNFKQQVQQQQTINAQLQQQIQALMTNPFDVLIHQTGLRPPQRGAVDTIMDHFGNGGIGETVLLVIHTGCGKSGIIAVAPFFMNRPRPTRVLVITPNVNIKNQLGETLRGKDAVLEPIPQPAKPRFLVEKGLLPRTPCLPALPTVGVITGPLGPTVAEQNQIIVTNIQRLDADRLAPFPRHFFDVVIVDEAHHYPAPSYITVIDHFLYARRVFLTATPFRPDPLHPLPLTPSYTYTYSNAVEDQLIKPFEPIVNATGDNLYNSVLHEVQVKLQQLNAANAAGQIPPQPHQAIVFAKTNAEADTIGQLCEQLHIRYVVIYGSTTRAQDAVNGFKFSTHDVAVVVGMMLEGYDNPRLSIAAFTYSIKSLKKYIQAVGRVIRRSSSPRPEDNKAYVITHRSLNISTMHAEYMENQGVVDPNEELNDDAGAA